MRLRGLFLAAALAGILPAQQPASVGERARQYLIDLIRLDTTNPPGHETQVAKYIERVTAESGIGVETLGGDASRLNCIARLRGSGKKRPLLLMAHSDVVPADEAQWTVPAFAGEIRDGWIYGRGARDDKNLLAAEMAVMVELKRRGIRLNRDVILLAEADEESGSSGIQWVLANAWKKIEAEAALNESGVIEELHSGIRVFQVQTAEKIPTRIALRARGTAGHGALPRADNAIMRLARAITRLDMDQPVRLNATTRRYFSELARVPEYEWMAPLLPMLEEPDVAMDAAASIRARDPELDTQLHTTISPTILSAGTKINVIPNMAEAFLDVRRLPDETREDIMDRVRRMVNDNLVEVVPGDEQGMPATEPSSITGETYAALERVLRESAPRSLVIPYMSRGATDGSYLRQKGTDVYGVPLFAREDADSRVHGNDERISETCLASGAELLWRIVLAVAAEPSGAEAAAK